ncbi:MAG: amidohydrolase family protein [Bacillota bacterium]
MSLIIKNGLVWDGTGAPARTDLAVVADNGKVTRLCPVSEVVVKDGDEVIDAAGKFVMPGMIDNHVHIHSSGDADTREENRESVALRTLRAAHYARLDLEAGFTTVRNMGSGSGIDLGLKQAMQMGLATGARVITCGSCITMTGGHGWMGGREVDGADEARKAARELLKQGVELIKIMATGGVMTPGVEPGSPQLTEEEIRAAVEEAHKAGRKTATHAQGTEGIKNAVRAGIDSVEHGIFLDDEVIEMMKARGTALIPTLVAPLHIVEGGLAAGIPAYAVEKANRVFDAHRNSFKMALAAGVKIGMGTDAGTPLNRHGDNSLELQMLVENGMTPEQALLAATKINAEIADRANLIGTLEAGKFADILVVDGNPLEDIKVLRNKENIKLVIKEGKVVVCR